MRGYTWSGPTSDRQSTVLQQFLGQSKDNWWSVIRTVTLTSYIQLQSTTIDQFQLVQWALTQLIYVQLGVSHALNSDTSVELDQVRCVWHGLDTSLITCSSASCWTQSHFHQLQNIAHVMIFCSRWKRQYCHTKSCHVKLPRRWFGVV